MLIQAGFPWVNEGGEFLHLGMTAAEEQRLPDGAEQM
jgi:hypothetical protein